MNQRSVVDFLTEIGMLSEMRNWYQQYKDGNPQRGIIPIDVATLDIVKDLLGRHYLKDKQIDNNGLAPWLINAISNEGSELPADKIVQIDDIIKWFKEVASGNIKAIEGKSLSDAHRIVSVALSAKKTEAGDKSKTSLESERIKEWLDIWQNEKKMVELDYVIGDGSGRFWVNVLDSNWYTELCESGKLGEKHHGKGYYSGIAGSLKKYGLSCQSESGGPSSYSINGQNSAHTLVGPPKGDLGGPISTLLSLYIRGTKFDQFMQQGNVVPGSQSLLGYDDLATMAILFFVKSKMLPVKQAKTIQGSYSNGIFNLMEYSKDGWVYLMKARPDILETNKEIMKTYVRKFYDEDFDTWYLKLTKSVEEMINDSPVDFVRNISQHYKQRGGEVKSNLHKIDLGAINALDHEAILSGFVTLMEILEPEQQEKLYAMVDIEQFISSRSADFKDMVLKFSRSKTLKKVSFKMLDDKFVDIVQQFGGGGVGLNKLMLFLGQPKLEEHQGAIKNKITGDYIAQREEKMDAQGDVVQEKESIVVPDDLKILSKKDKRLLMRKHQNEIRGFFSDLGKEEGKINFLRHYIREASQQDIEKELTGVKEEIIEFYDKKFEEGKSNLPGIFEFHTIINKHNPGAILPIPVSDQDNWSVLPLLPVMPPKDINGNRNLIFKYLEGKSNIDFTTKKAQNKPELIQGRIKKRMHVMVTYLRLLQFSGLEKDKVVSLAVKGVSFVTNQNTSDIASIMEYLKMIRKLISPEIATTILEDHYKTQYINRYDEKRYEQDKAKLSEPLHKNDDEDEEDEELGESKQWVKSYKSFLLELANKRKITYN